MSGIKASTALQAVGAQALIVLSAEGAPPPWIMLMPTPKDGVILTVDGRGPYRVSDPARLAANSMPSPRVPLPIDENHSTDLAAPEGRPSPARAWITELQARDDGTHGPAGIYGKVDWTESGKQLLADKAYRGISPVFMHDAGNTVTRILRASLCNNPNLRDITALQTETNMDLLVELRKILGLPETADAAAVLAAVKDKMSGGAVATQAAALQSQVTAIAKAAGLKDDAEPAAVLQAVTTLAAKKDAPGAAEFTALQTELASVTTKLNAFQADAAKARATTYVDAEIAKGRVGVKPLRDHYITMHTADPARVEKEIGALPVIGPSGALQTPPGNKDGKIALSAEQTATAKLLGIKPEDYAKTLATEQAQAASA